jgi:hypothetical protein
MDSTARDAINLCLRLYCEADVKISGTIVVGLLLLAIAVAAIAGSRLSDQAVAIVAGVACGVGLAVPLGVTIGVLIGTSRNRQASIEPAPPRIIVVPSAPPSPSHAVLPAATTPAPRSFTIIGEDDTDEP